MAEKSPIDYNQIFEAAHADGVDLLGTKWLSLNERARNVVILLGYDYTDQGVRALISKMVLEIAKGMLELDNIQKAELEEKYFMMKKDKNK